MNVLLNDCLLKEESMNGGIPSIALLFLTFLRARVALLEALSCLAYYRLLSSTRLSARRDFTYVRALSSALTVQAEQSVDDAR